MAANDPMTLTELIAKLGEMAPYLEQRAADVIEHNAAWNLPEGTTALDLVQSQGHGYMLGIGIMDFLCWAFGEPHRGWVPREDLRR